MIYSWEQYLQKLEQIWQVNYWNKKEYNQRFTKHSNLTSSSNEDS